MPRPLFAVATALAGFTLAPQPLAAQDEAPQVAQSEAEPLTAEQQARILAAEPVVDRIFPPGTLSRMSSGTMQPLIDHAMSLVMEEPKVQIADLTGMDPDDLPMMDQEALDEVMAILDPALDERTELMRGATMQLVTDILTEIEPHYRTRLVHAYARRFTEAELVDISAYFSTPVGARYAAELMFIHIDPKVLSVMNEMLPTMVRLMPDLVAKAKEAEAKLPPPRTFSDLEPAQQARLAEMLSKRLLVLGEAEPDRAGSVGH